MAHTSDDHARWPHDDVFHGYWVDPGTLLAGEHPELHTEGPEGISMRLSLLAAAGILTTVDLASRGRSDEAYGATWIEMGRRLGREHRRLARPIDERGVIGGQGFVELVGEIDAELAAGRPVYVHCAHGVDRTGTVVGVWLRRSKGLDFEETMQRIANARAGTQKASWACPEPQEFRGVIKRAGQTLVRRP
jgi:hypothetical protein